ncbi:MAG TPA: HD domain-containing protein [Candidatus Eremiobacteraceae bacterium]
MERVPHNVPHNEIDAALLRVLPDGGVFAVGGRVRDEVLAELGRPNLDDEPNFDYLVTGLSVDAIIAALTPLGPADFVGISFGVIKLATHGTIVDIAIPRRERSTGTHHRDFDPRFGPEIAVADDLARRDFRINMMARDLKTGAIIDPFGGRSDLANKRLDALMESAFVEDPLRVLRGAQFAARFGLTATASTLDAMRAASDLIPTVAPERVAEELTKLLGKARIPSIGFELLREVSALHHILPELMEGWQIEQNEFHAHTVYYHSLACCDFAEQDERPRDLAVRLAALLHDVGKPRTKEGPHFYRHEQVGEEMAREALSRLRFASNLVDRVCRLIANHMYPSDDGLTDAAIRRFIRRIRPELVDDQFKVRHADVRASGLAPRDGEEQARFERRVRDELERKPPFGIKDLAIGGADVIEVMKELGIAGRDFAGDERVGKALANCLEQVLDDPCRNETVALRAIVRDHFTAGVR